MTYLEGWKEKKMATYFLTFVLYPVKDWKQKLWTTEKLLCWVMKSNHKLWAIFFLIIPYLLPKWLPETKSFFISKPGT